ncbi:MAG: NodT family efflux transporter outer membrane factor (OMF) lipoprotein [Parasphingorhabdus sp.]|jgi:NodT family efflux transporter outer membrane factor (OMF) lipoprotein
MRRAQKAFLVAWVALALQACSIVGPDYQEPNVEWLDEWQTDLYGQAMTMGTTEDDLDFWWLAFNDPVLNGLIETAREKNPTLQIAALAIVQSKALLGIATGNQYPQQQQLSGSWARTDSWSTEGNNSGNHSNLNSYNIGSNVGWELDFWGRFRRSIESADAAFFASISNYQNAQVLLSAQMAQAYFTYLTTLQQINIAQENGDLQKRSMEITTSLFESGQSSELDVQQAKTQYLGTLASIPSLEISMKQIENSIAVLLGRSPGKLTELTRVAEELPALSPMMIEGVPAKLMMRRPDVRTAAWQVAAQSAQIGVAEADFYPAISLFGTIGWSGNSLNTTNDSVGTGFGPSVTWNLFNYGRIENNVRVQDASLQQLIESYQLTVLGAASEIDNAAISVVKTRERDGFLKEALVAAERSLVLSSKRYQEGYSDFQRVLSAQLARAAASSNYVANQGDHINAVIAFYKALGGGWQPVDGEDLIPNKIRQIMEQRTDWGGMLDAPIPAADE